MTAAYRADTDAAGPRPARPRAAGQRDDPRDRRSHRAVDRAWACVCGGRRRATSPCAPTRNTESCPTATSTTWIRARGWRAQRASATRSISRSGRPRSRARTPRGTRRGAGAAPAGTSSARRWPRGCWGSTSRSTAVARTSSSPTTRTRRPRPRRPATGRSRGYGCTTGWSVPPGLPTRPRRWPSRSGTSSCSARRSTASAATR